MLVQGSEIFENLPTVWKKGWVLWGLGFVGLLLVAMETPTMGNIEDQDNYLS